LASRRSSAPWGPVGHPPENGAGSGRSRAVQPRSARGAHVAELAGWLIHEMRRAPPHGGGFARYSNERLEIDPGIRVVPRGSPFVPERRGFFFVEVGWGAPARGLSGDTPYGRPHHTSVSTVKDVSHGHEEEVCSEENRLARRTAPRHGQAGGSGPASLTCLARAQAGILRSRQGHSAPERWPRHQTLQTAHP